VDKEAGCMALSVMGRIEGVCFNEVSSFHSLMCRRGSLPIGSLFCSFAMYHRAVDMQSLSECLERE
jgi:hypothetical protein